jgi:hypothetical protein
MNNGIFVVAAGLIVVSIWMLILTLKNMQRMLYALLTKGDGGPQCGDSIMCASGKRGKVLWRRWNGAEEYLAVRYQDGSGLDIVSLDTLLPISKTRFQNDESMHRSSSLRLMAQKADRDPFGG